MYDPELNYRQRYKSWEGFGGVLWRAFLAYKFVHLYGPHSDSQDATSSGHPRETRGEQVEGTAQAADATASETDDG